VTPLTTTTSTTTTPGTTRSDLTHIYVLLDRSGSMQSIKDDIVGGFDAFVAEQRRGVGECRMSLARFDNEYELVFSDLPVEQVGALLLDPRGSTALLDSLGRLVVDAGARLAALPESQRPGTVVVAVMTDGMENASREWTHPAIKALVDQQTGTYGWQFLYMGADQDAVEVGRGLGIDAAHAMTWTRGSAAAAMQATSAKVADLRHARRADPAAAMRAYTEAERREASAE
jgi:hypothetical protein